MSNRDSQTVERGTRPQPFFIHAMFIVGLFAFASPAFADHDGGGGHAPAAEPVHMPRPEVPDTRNQQVNRGRGGGCASCSVGDTSSGLPTAMFSLLAFALTFARRRP